MGPGEGPGLVLVAMGQGPMWDGAEQSFVEANPVFKHFLALGVLACLMDSVSTHPLHLPPPTCSGPGGSLCLPGPVPRSPLPAGPLIHGPHAELLTWVGVVFPGAHRLSTLPLSLALDWAPWGQ